MGTKSKPFRAFVEGETISDGRKVTPEMIDECVATFAPATYSPRINLEHVSGYSPEPPFNGYGDVVSLEAKTDDIVIAGKSEKRHALYAIVEGQRPAGRAGPGRPEAIPVGRIHPQLCRQRQVRHHRPGLH
ncbi:GPO family capsid scaffolding protein [Sphingomonas sp. 22R3R2A-7]|uniref:GPO family capsid scaffolding protein n=1 Tax=Sphingomonas sp. 22R3R2A-7 TaxID=3050230 RepID=UPI002FE2EA1D